MENDGVYSVVGGEVAYVRAECLRAASDGWEVPTRQEVLMMVRRAGGVERVKTLLGLASRRELNRWTTGQEPIRYADWVLLCEAGGEKVAWR